MFKLLTKAENEKSSVISLEGVDDDLATILQAALAVDYNLSHNLPLRERVTEGMEAALHGIWDGRGLAEKHKPAKAPAQPKMQ